MNPFVLEAKGLTKEFYHPEKVVILQGISLQVSLSESLSIMGPSGSGKSTLLHILGTLEEPTSGSLYFYGDTVTPARVPEIRSRHCGFVFQSANLLEEYTLLDNLLLKARIARRPLREAREEALHLLEQVALSSRVHFLVKYLSGGEKQRGAIARALMNDPDLILADEPTGNLDKACAEQTQEILLGCCKKLGKSLIVVTHDSNFANLAETKLHLEDGVIHYGPCARSDTKPRPAH